MVMPFYSLN